MTCSGSLAGVLLIGVLSSALRLQQTGSDVIEIIIGVLLILSVISTNLLDRLRARGSPAPRTARSTPGAGPRRITKGNAMNWKSKRFAAATGVALAASIVLAGVRQRLQQHAPRAAASTAERPPAAAVT